ncbi:coiled-coil domain-containing protein 24 [Genypterus blacodes]|uniref:coiled-coil domain-containing protein 24 n=1 Tax=Genypterus blacodes TaxID=154954 RepID=UPI003F76505B
MQCADGNQACSPGQSLWSLMSEHVPRSELSKVRAALGESLVDLYTDAHSEAERWHKIQQGVQQQQQGGRHRNQAGTPLPRLADPPAIKELVRAEIRMLLRCIREKAASEGRDGEDVLCRYKPEAVNYALGHTYSNLTHPADTNTSQHGSRCSSRCSVQSSIEEEIEAVRDKLNITDIDQVVEHLKSLLTEECEVLKSQVKHLQESIKKHRSEGEAAKSEPSLAATKTLSLCPETNLRTSAGLKAPDKTLRPLTPTADLRPHPPPLSQPKPSPPPGAPKTSASIRKLSVRSLSERVI